MSKQVSIKVIKVKALTETIRRLERLAQTLPEPACSEVITAIKSLNYARESLTTEAEVRSALRRIDYFCEE